MVREVDQIMYYGVLANSELIPCDIGSLLIICKHMVLSQDPCINSR